MLGTNTQIEEELVNQAKRENVDRLVVGAIIGRHRQNILEILVLKRADDDFMSGIEELPSGKVESNETILNALTREVLEETNLKTKEILEHIFDFDYKSSSGKLTRQFNFVLLPMNDDVVINPSEHSAYRWINLQQISDSLLTNNIKSTLVEKWKHLEKLF